MPLLRPTRLAATAALIVATLPVAPPALAAGPVPSTMPCCLSAPRVLADGAFKYVGIPYRFAYPPRAIPAFAPTGPSAPFQPEAPAALAPTAPASATGAQVEMAAGSPPPPGAPTRR